jgi:hypothetical protein
MASVERISVALAAAWPAAFLPMPDRRERVCVIVAHHALRAEIRRRGEATGGAVSGEDLARWVDSVIVYSRAVQTLTALRAIREAGAAYHIHPGGTMQSQNGTTSTEPDAARTRAIATAAIKSRRSKRIAEILTKIRSILDVNEMRATDNFETWSAFALLFAIAPEEPQHTKEIHRRLAAVLTKNMAANGALQLTHARVLNLTDALAWIADEGHAPYSWPHRGTEDE